MSKERCHNNTNTQGGYQCRAPTEATVAKPALYGRQGASENSKRMWLRPPFQCSRAASCSPSATLLGDMPSMLRFFRQLSHLSHIEGG